MKILRMDSKSRVPSTFDQQKEEEVVDLIPYNPFIDVANLPFHMKNYLDELAQSDNKRLSL